MRQRICFPRITRRDCERMLDVHQQLKRVRDALEHCSWAGGRMAAGGIMSALVMISEMYNQAERAFLPEGVSQPGPSFQDGQVEIPPAAEPELAAPAPASEPGKRTIERADSTSWVVRYAADARARASEIPIHRGDVSSGECPLRAWNRPQAGLSQARPALDACLRSKSTSNEAIAAGTAASR
jgi:hypothetical protein